MSYRIPRASLEVAVSHLVRFGDTDIFPHLPELALFADEQAAVVDELSKLDLDSYTPAGAIEALAPKGRYSFRIAHQLSALDTVLLLACVIEIGNEIEARRLSADDVGSFSYRFALNPTNGGIFRTDRIYKEWLDIQNLILEAFPEVVCVVSTDISDYYSRINVHRLENLLDEVAPKRGAVRFIKKHIGIIRAKQSFGLPVGGSAARLLAELALVDTDQAFDDMGLIVTRFVDDFRIFLRPTEDPYVALGALAEQLGINEGLSLNSSKTWVAQRDEYQKTLSEAMSDLEKEAHGVAVATLTSALYFDEEPHESDMEVLKGLNLVGMLEAEVDSPAWDIGRIRVIFRALRIVKPHSAILFIKKRFFDLVVFAKELVLLMEELENDTRSCFDDLHKEVVQAILSPPASSVQVIRTWLMELFVRNIIRITSAASRKLDGLPTLTDKKQLLLIRGRCGDINYFRKQKTAVQSFSNVELPCLVLGASCLPQDEYDIWLQRMVAMHMNKPLDSLFLRWASKNKLNLMRKLKVPILGIPE